MTHSNRRRFLKTLATATAAASAVRRVTAMQTPTANPEPRRALVFDAYGTLFDVFSVTSLCEELFPGQGQALATMWRAKQLQYTLLRSMMNRYKDFWQLTRDGL